MKGEVRKELFSPFALRTSNFIYPLLARYVASFLLFAASREKYWRYSFAGAATKKKPELFMLRLTFSQASTLTSF